MFRINRMRDAVNFRIIIRCQMFVGCYMNQTYSSLLLAIMAYFRIIMNCVWVGARRSMIHIPFDEEQANLSSKSYLARWWVLSKFIVHDLIHYWEPLAIVHVQDEMIWRVGNCAWLLNYDDTIQFFNKDIRLSYT